MTTDDFEWLDDFILEDDSFEWLSDDYKTETTRQLSSPRLHARKEARRRMVNGLKKQALTELIPELPPPDVDLYVIGNGAGAEVRHGINPQSFDFGAFLPHVVRMLGNRDCTAYVSTWTMNRNHALTMIEMLDAGNLARLTVFTDPYFKRRTPAIAATLINGILKHPGRARFLAFKNHVKVICIANSDQNRFVTITGSANLSAQPRCEQYVLTTAPDVYRFFVDEFYEAMLSDER